MQSEAKNEQELLAEAENIFTATAELLNVPLEQINRDAEVKTILSLFACVDRTQENRIGIQNCALARIRTGIEQLNNTKTQLMRDSDTLRAQETQKQTRLENEKIELRVQLDAARKRITDEIEKITRKIAALANNIRSLKDPDIKALQMKRRRSKAQVDNEVTHLTAQQETAEQTLRRLENDLAQNPQIIDLLRQIEQNEREQNKSQISHKELAQAFLEQLQELDQELLYFETMRALFIVSAITPITPEKDFETAALEASETDEAILKLTTPKVAQHAPHVMPLFAPMLQEELLAFAREQNIVREILVPEPSGKRYSPAPILKQAGRFIEDMYKQGEKNPNMPLFFSFKSPLMEMEDEIERSEAEQAEKLKGARAAYERSVQASLFIIHTPSTLLEAISSKEKRGELRKFFEFILPRLQKPFWGAALKKIPQTIRTVNQSVDVANQALHEELCESTAAETIIHAAARKYGLSPEAHTRLIDLPIVQRDTTSYLGPFLGIHPLNPHQYETLCTVVDPEKNYPHLPYIGSPAFATQSKIATEEILKTERSISQRIAAINALPLKSTKRTSLEQQRRDEEDHLLACDHALNAFLESYGKGFAELLFGMAEYAHFTNLPNRKLELSEQPLKEMLGLSQKRFKKMIAAYLNASELIQEPNQNFQAIVNDATEQCMQFLNEKLQASSENGLYCHGVLHFWVIEGKKFGPVFGSAADAELRNIFAREHVNAMLNDLIDEWFVPCFKTVIPDLDPAIPLIPRPGFRANPIGYLKARVLPKNLWLADMAHQQYQERQERKRAGTAEANGFAAKAGRKSLAERREDFLQGSLTIDDLCTLLAEAGYQNDVVTRKTEEIRVPTSENKWPRREISYYDVTSHGLAALWKDMCDGTLLKKIHAVLFQDATNPSHSDLP